MKVSIPTISDCFASAPAWSELLTKVNGNQRLLKDVLVLLGREVPRLGTAFQQAVEKGDCREARRAVHTLKSNCRQFDLRLWSEFSQTLEELAQNADVAELAAYVPAVLEMSHAIADWTENVLASNDLLDNV